MTFPRLGSLWMLVAGVFFAIMGALVKLCALKFSSPELVFYRSIFGFFAILLLMHNNLGDLATSRWKLHCSRSVFGFISLILFFYGISELPLATAMTLNYTSPIFLSITTALYMRRMSKPILITAILIGFLGVILLLHPTFSSNAWLAGIAGLASGMLAGFVYFQVYQLGKMGESEWRTVFYFTLTCTVGSGIWMIFHHFHPVRFMDAIELACMGTAATIAQLAMTRAYKNGNPLVVGGLAYCTVVFSSFIGITFWGDHLPVESWLGILLIVFSGVLSVFFRSKAIETAS